MLVLKRQVNEAIKIGKDITIKVIQIQRSGVRLGITAPEDLHIDRIQNANLSEDTHK